MPPAQRFSCEDLGSVPSIREEPVTIGEVEPPEANWAGSSTRDEETPRRLSRASRGSWKGRVTPTLQRMTSMGSATSSFRELVEVRTCVFSIVLRF